MRRFTRRFYESGDGGGEGGGGAAATAADPAAPAQTDPTPQPPTQPAAQQARASSVPPTPGRIVLYVDGDGDSFPAIVSAVTDAELHLTVFDAVMGPRLYCIAVDAYGTQAGQWSWPGRV